MSGPPPDSQASEEHKAGWLDGYGGREKFEPDIDANHPDYIRGHAKGKADRSKTDRRLRKAGLR